MSLTLDSWATLAWIYGDETTAARRKSWKRRLQFAIYCVMKRDEAISRLQQHEADLKRLGVENLYMFGSTARDEAGDDSDVDLFFDHEKASSVCLS